MIINLKFKKDNKHSILRWAKKQLWDRLKCPINVSFMRTTETDHGFKLYTENFNNEISE